MQPVLVAPDTERGYYIVWNTATWSRERVSNSASLLCLSLAADHRPRESLCWSIRNSRVCPTPQVRSMCRYRM